LQYPLGIFDLGLLFQQFSRPIAQLIDRTPAFVAGTQAKTDGKRAADDHKHAQNRRRDDDRVAQIKLFHTARLTADEDDIHSDGSNADVIMRSGCIASYFRLCPGSVRLD